MSVYVDTQPERVDFMMISQRFCVDLVIPIHRGLYSVRSSSAVGVVDSFQVGFCPGVTFLSRHVGNLSNFVLIPRIKTESTVVVYL